jgi:uncharacterized C2H2 Zn-finger protein
MKRGRGKKPSAKAATGPKFEPCPKCGQLFDARGEQVVSCPRCGKEGSTACCNPAGVGCICIACEEAQP